MPAPEKLRQLVNTFSLHLDDYKSGTFNEAQVRQQPYLKDLPIRRIDFSNRSDKSRHDRFVSLVDQMLALHKQLAKAKTPPARSSLEHQIAATDRQIDRIVYDLYGLTEEEIRIVEDGTGG
jgi:hypothetical protein